MIAFPSWGATIKGRCFIAWRIVCFEWCWWECRAKRWRPARRRRTWWTRHATGCIKLRGRGRAIALVGWPGWCRARKWWNWKRGVPGWCNTIWWWLGRPRVFAGWWHKNKWKVGVGKGKNSNLPPCLLWPNCQWWRSDWWCRERRKGCRNRWILIYISAVLAKKNLF